MRPFFADAYSKLKAVVFAPIGMKMAIAEITLIGN